MGLATEWRKVGMVEGNLVTLMMDNSTDYYIPVFAAWLCGAGVSLTDPDLSASTLASQLKLTGSRFLVTSSRVLGTSLHMQKEFPEIELDIYTLGSNQLEVKNTEDFYANIYREFKDDHKVENSDDDIAAIFWSSGTTGDPKGIPYHQKFIFSTDLFTHMDQRSPSLLTTCMFHVVGFLKVLNFLIVNKQSCIYLDPSCSASDMVQAIRTWAPVRAIVKSFHLPKLSCHQEEEYHDPLTLSSLQDFIPTGAPVPLKYEAQLFNKFKGLKVIKNYYGMTELAEVSVGMTLGSIGKPVQGTIVKIVEPGSGEFTEDGQVGEIWVKKEERIKNYINSELSIWDQAGWAHTGDLAFVDAAGNMVFVDRVKSLIKFEGKHVQPAEIERLL